MGLHYRYYDTPDGQDYVKKQWYLFKHSLYAAGLFTAMDIFWAKNKGYGPMFGRMMKVFWRIPLGTFVFEPTVYISTHILGFDTPWTHVFGLAATTLYSSKFFPNPHFLIMVFVPTAFAMFGFKYVRTVHHRRLFPDPYNARDNLDHSLFTDYVDWFYNSTHPEKGYLTLTEAMEQGLVKNRDDAIRMGFLKVRDD